MLNVPRTNHTNENKTYSMKNENGSDSSTEDSGSAGLIAGTVVPILLIVGLIILALVFWWKRHLKRIQEEEDENPNYDTLDYEENFNDNGSSREVSHRSREITPREVKAEVCDTCSIYGEEEEGWEDAVIVDANPD